MLLRVFMTIVSLPDCCVFPLVLSSEALSPPTSPRPLLFPLLSQRPSSPPAWWAPPPLWLLALARAGARCEAAFLEGASNCITRQKCTVLWTKRNCYYPNLAAHLWLSVLWHIVWETLVYNTVCDTSGEKTNKLLMGNIWWIQSSVMELLPSICSYANLCTVGVSGIDSHTAKLEKVSSYLQTFICTQHQRLPELKQCSNSDIKQTDYTTQNLLFNEPARSRCFKIISSCLNQTTKLV